MPLQWDGEAWLTPVVVDGHSVPFLLDTGSERSMLFEATAARLHIQRDEWAATPTAGIGGIVDLPNADPHTLTLGGVPLQRRTLAADNTLTVGVAGAGPADGLLGQDFLSVYDVELDFVRDVLRLYSATVCLGAADLPWAGPRAAIRATRVFRDVLLVPVSVDGRPLWAMIDSGSAISVVTASGMVKLGLDEAAVASDPTRAARGIGSGGVTLRQHRFDRFQVGPIVAQNNSLWVGPIRLPGKLDMLLGADWLRGRKVWLSFATDTVFISLPSRGASQ
ncbi:MAG: aspartyl protease family protein [Acetobacteraceae bacterium]|nr:aspartyl protease family protein [Acetobacteraceae bacterium]